jgi:hypothetical protein
MSQSGNRNPPWLAWSRKPRSASGMGDGIGFPEPCKGRWPMPMPNADPARGAEGAPAVPSLSATPSMIGGSRRGGGFVLAGAG